MFDIIYILILILSIISIGNVIIDIRTTLNKLDNQKKEAEEKSKAIKQFILDNQKKEAEKNIKFDIDNEFFKITDEN